MEINGSLILLLALLVMPLAYFTYGKYLVRQWGIDPFRRTPAHELFDNNDFVPTRPLVVFGHEFSSIAGAGPFTGAIIALMFGWLPVVIWLIIGSIFFGAMHDFLVLFTSVRNRGESIGAISERYLGKGGRRLFLTAIWCFAVLCSAAFLDIVAATFAVSEKLMIDSPQQAIANGSVASASALFILAAIILGFLIRKRNASDLVSGIVAIDLLVLCIALGVMMPIYLTHSIWLHLILGYIFVSSVLPIWFLHQPRNYLSSFLLIALIVVSVLGIMIARPEINLPAFTGWQVNGNYLFPALFIMIACGAISGFHSLVVSNFTSRQVSNEKYLLPVSYGSMLFEMLLATVAVIAASSLAVDGKLPAGAPPTLFARGVASFLHTIGLTWQISFTVVSLAISAFVLTTLDALARLLRLTIQELFAAEQNNRLARWFCQPVVASLLSLAAVYILSRIGYQRIWAMFGASNQLLASLAMMIGLLFLKHSGRSSWMVVLPIILLLSSTLTLLGLTVLAKIKKYLAAAATFDFTTDGLQLFIAIILIVLAIIITIGCGRALLRMRKTKAAITSSD